MKIKNYGVIQPICATLEENAEKAVIIFSDADQSEFLPVRVDLFEAEILIREMIGESQETAAVWLSEMMADSHPTEAILHLELRRIEFRLEEPNWNPSRFLGLADGIILARRLSCKLIVLREAFAVQRAELDRLYVSGAITNSSLFFDPEFSSTSLYGCAGLRGFPSRWSVGGGFFAGTGKQQECFPTGKEI